MKPVTIINKVVNLLGYDLRRHTKLGTDPIADMKLFLCTDRPVLFDVGANRGQSVASYHKAWPASTIHAFEPSPATYAQLADATSAYENVNAWNAALGAAPGSLTLFENSHSKMSSLLPLGETGGGVIQQETEVEVKTIDQFAEAKNIDRIDMLKSDTQGYDLEVLKGAEGMLKDGRIGLVYAETIFSEMYGDMPPFYEGYAYLLRHNYRLVSFYKFYYQQKLASWTDALFVHEDTLNNSGS